MSATLIIEDGSGSNPEANSYSDVAYADAYFLAALIHADWDAASSDLKIRALITATRVIDTIVEFKGFKATLNQPLQWPRILSRDQNQYGGAYYQRPDSYLAQYYDSATVPKGVKDAVCDFAQVLITGNNNSDNRTDDAPGKGIGEFEIYQGIKVKFDKKDQRPIIPDSIAFGLLDFGAVRSSHSGNARVERT